MSLDKTLSVAAKIELLDGLVRSEGWKLYCEYLQNSYDAAQHQVLTPGVSSEVRSFCAGTMSGVKEVKQWPEVTLRFLRAGLARRDEGME